MYGALAGSGGRRRDRPGATLWSKVIPD